MVTQLSFLRVEFLHLKLRTLLLTFSKRGKCYLFHPKAVSIVKKVRNHLNAQIKVWSVTLPDPQTGSALWPEEGVPGHLFCQGDRFLPFQRVPQDWTERRVIAENPSLPHTQNLVRSSRLGQRDRAWRGCRNQVRFRLKHHLIFPRKIRVIKH